MKINRFQLLLFISILVRTVAGAQSPQLVHDVNPDSAHSSPVFLTVLNGKLFFIANHDYTGYELWSFDSKSNRPPAFVEDFFPGPTSGLPWYDGDRPLPVWNNKMYFQAYTNIWTKDLYSFDGTVPKLVDLGMGHRFFYTFHSMVPFNNRLFFCSGTDSAGYELFAYDGINTPRLYDIMPGVRSSWPGVLTPFNGKLFFQALDSAAGEELFMYDPVTDTCTLVADINPGSHRSYCNGFTVIQNKLYFSASIMNYGSELCVFDGAAVTRLTDINPGYGNSLTGQIRPAYFKGDIIFTAAPDNSAHLMYRYNISSGAVSVVDSSMSIYPNQPFTEFKGELYFRGKKGDAGYELWKFDGNSLKMVADIYPGPKSSYPDNLMVYNDDLYFTALDSLHGQELYRYTGISAGIELLIASAEAGFFPNPAGKSATIRLKLQTPQSLRVLINDMAGREVYSTGLRPYAAGTTDMLIPLQSLVAGHYSYALSGVEGQRIAGGIFAKE